MSSENRNINININRNIQRAQNVETKKNSIFFFTIINNHNIEHTEAFIP